METILVRSYIIIVTKLGIIFKWQLSVVKSQECIIMISANVVQLPFVAPNWPNGILVLIYMGWRSLSSCCGGVTIGKGDTSALFKICGMKPSCRELLTIEQIELASWPGKSWKTQFGMLSDPSAFLSEIVINLLSTSAIVMLYMYLASNRDAGCWWVGVSFVRSLLILWKDCLVKFANGCLYHRWNGLPDWAYS